jgi:ERCC4-related helicase
MDFDLQSMKYFPDGSGELSDEQLEGMDFLLNRQKAILAFQTGLGKTITSLMSVDYLMRKNKSIRTVIICPVKALKAFRKELLGKMAYKDEEVGWVNNQVMEYNTDTNKVYIFTYSSLKKYQSLVRQLKRDYILVGIFDEAHKLQAKDSQIKILMEELKPCFSVTWLCTATPLLNDIVGSYNLVNFLYPKFFGSKTAFENRYTTYELKDIYIRGGGGKKRKVKRITGSQNEEELQEKLKDLMIMRQKKYNLKFAFLGADLTKEEEDLYEKVSAGIMDDEERAMSARMHDLQRVVDNSYSNDLVGPRHSSKEEKFIETLKQIFIKNFSIVVYVDYLDTVDRLREVLNSRKEEIGFRKLFEITGSIKLHEREMVEESIEERDIILITSAGSESINLQRANCVMFYNIPFSVGTCLQVIGRVTRVDTEFSNQFVFILYAKGTIDEYKYLSFMDNAKLIKDIVGSDANMPSDLKKLDKKNVDEVRTKLLWHFKDTGRKQKRIKAKLIENNLVVSGSNDYGMLDANYKINLSPKGIELMNTKRIPGLVPEDEVYNLLIEDANMFSIFRNKYITHLRGPEGSKVVWAFVDSILNKGKKVMLVDDFGLGSIIKKHIMEHIKE